MNDTPLPDDPDAEASGPEDSTDFDPAEAEANTDAGVNPASESAAGMDDGNSRDAETAEVTEAPASSGGFKAGPFLIVAVLVCIFAFIQVQRKVADRAAREEQQTREQAIANSAVALSVTWSNTKRLPLFEMKWYPGLTARELMLTAQDEGVLTFEETGEGDAAMLTSIGGTKNEGGDADSHNWIFRVNGKMADRGFGIYELKEGDIVSWEFSTYE